MEDGEDSDDAPKGGRNKDKPDGRRMEKAQAKKVGRGLLHERSKCFNDVGKEATMEKHLETKVALAEKKNQGKEKKWATRCTLEECKISIEEKKMTVENWPKRIGYHGNDGKRVLGTHKRTSYHGTDGKRVLGTHKSGEIMYRRRQELHDLMVGYGTPTNGGGGDGASANAGGGDVGGGDGGASANGGGGGDVGVDGGIGDGGVGVGLGGGDVADILDVNA